LEREEERQERSVEIAKKMILEELEDNFISKITDLTLNQLQKRRNEIR